MIDLSSPEMQPIFGKEFTNNGQTYEYRYDLLTNVQVRLAETVYRTMHQRQDKAPGSITEALAAGNHNYKIYALSFLLRKKNADGSVANFEKPDVMTWEKSPAFQFVENLPATRETDIEEVLTDFFQRAGLYLLRYSVDMRHIGSVLQTGNIAHQLSTMLKVQPANSLNANSFTALQNSAVE